LLSVLRAGATLSRVNPNPEPQQHKVTGYPSTPHSGQLWLSVESRIRPKGGVGLTPGKLLTLSKLNPYPKSLLLPQRRIYAKVQISEIPSVDSTVHAHLLSILRTGAALPRRGGRLGAATLARASLGAKGRGETYTYVYMYVYVCICVYVYLFRESDIRSVSVC